MMGIVFGWQRKAIFESVSNHPQKPESTFAEKMWRSKTSTLKLPGIYKRGLYPFGKNSIQGLILD